MVTSSIRIGWTAGGSDSDRDSTIDAFNFIVDWHEMVNVTNNTLFIVNFFLLIMLIWLGYNTVTY